MYRQALLKLKRLPVNKVLSAIAAGVAILMAGGALLVWVGSIAADAADTKSRLKVVEKRQEEDRTDMKEKVREIDVKVQRVDDNVQTILRKLDVMEDRRNAEARRR
jgi:hypothetical protein